MRVFLSASVPKVGRGTFYENSDPFLIQVAVRELVTSIVRVGTLVWGGHPSITPMIWAVCSDLGMDYSKHVQLYQSNRFDDDFPQENASFGNVTYVDAVNGNIEASLAEMRRRMVSDGAFSAGVFVGGMEGIIDEYQLFSQFQPDAARILLTAPGGAAQQLSAHTSAEQDIVTGTVDFAQLFHSVFPPADLDPAPRKLLKP